LLAVNEDVLYNYSMQPEDADELDNLILSAPELPSWLSFNTTTGVLSGTPTNEQVNTNATAAFNVRLRVTDESGAFVDQEFTITVTNVNDAPVINSQNTISTDEDEEVNITLSELNVTDVDDVYPDNFTLSVKPGLNYTLNENILIPDSDWGGTLMVPIELSDGESTTSYNLSVEVIPVNDAPIYTSTPVLSVTAGSDYQYWITCEDRESQELTISSSDLPEWLTLSLNGNVALLQGTPSNSHAGESEIVLSVTDGTNEVEQTFNLTVNVNTAVEQLKLEFAKVYPVPATCFVNFNFTRQLDQAMLEIYSTSGILIKKIDVSGLNHYELDVRDLIPNQYIFRLSDSDKVQNGFLVVE
jgi:hypothetical protein